MREETVWGSPRLIEEVAGGGVWPEEWRALGAEGRGHQASRLRGQMLWTMRAWLVWILLHGKSSRL